MSPREWAETESDAGQHCSREEGDAILPEHPFRKDLMLWATFCLYVSLPSLPTEGYYSEMVFLEVVKLT